MPIDVKKVRKMLRSLTPELQAKGDVWGVKTRPHNPFPGENIFLMSDRENMILISLSGDKVGINDIAGHKLGDKVEIMFLMENVPFKRNFPSDNCSNLFSWEKIIKEADYIATCPHCFQKKGFIFDPSWEENINVLIIIGWWRDHKHYSSDCMIVSSPPEIVRTKDMQRMFEIERFIKQKG